MEDGHVGHCELAVDGARWMMSDAFEAVGVAPPGPRPRQRRDAPPHGHRRRRTLPPGAAGGATLDRGPEDNPPIGRLAVFHDPFGHRWFLNQPLPEPD